MARSTTSVVSTSSQLAGTYTASLHCLLGLGGHFLAGQSGRSPSSSNNSRALCPLLLLQTGGTFLDVGTLATLKPSMFQLSSSKAFAIGCRNHFENNSKQCLDGASAAILYQLAAWSTRIQSLLPLPCKDKGVRPPKSFNVPQRQMRSQQPLWFGFVQLSAQCSGTWSFLTLLSLQPVWFGLLFYTPRK